MTQTYSRAESASLPSTTDDLGTAFAVPGDYNAVASAEGTYAAGTFVSQSATGDYAIFEFKDSVTASTVDITWTGKTDLDPSTNNVTLQVWNQSLTTWQTKATFSTSTVGSNFTISVTGLATSDYLVAGTLIARVYQTASAAPSSIAEQTGLTDYYPDYTINKYGTAFTISNPSGKHITSADIQLKRLGVPTGYAVATVYNTGGAWGTPGVNAVPDTTTGVIATSDQVDISSSGPIGTSGGVINFTFSGGNQIVPTNGNSYVVAVEFFYSGAYPDNSNYIKAGYYSAVAGMNWVYYNTSWHQDASATMYFVLNGA